MPAILENAQRLQDFVHHLTTNQGKIRAYIVTLLPGSPDVGDVLQETNLVLWTNRAKFETGSNFLAWALTIARYEVLSHRNRVKRRGRVLLSNELVASLAEEQPVRDDHERYLNALEACLTKLEPRQRELVQNRYQPGLSLESYARRTGRKASALRVALMRVRAALRDCIKGSLEGTSA